MATKMTLYGPMSCKSEREEFIEDIMKLVDSLKYKNSGAIFIERLGEGFVIKKPDGRYICKENKMKKECLLGVLCNVASALEGTDREIARQKIKELKQSDGEGWAIGETIERLLNLLGNLSKEERKEVEELSKKYLISGC